MRKIKILISAILLLGIFTSCAPLHIYWDWPWWGYQGNHGHSGGGPGGGGGGHRGGR